MYNALYYSGSVIIRWQRKLPFPFLASLRCFLCKLSLPYLAGLRFQFGVLNLEIKITKIILPSIIFPTIFKKKKERKIKKNQEKSRKRKNLSFLSFLPLLPLLSSSPFFLLDSQICSYWFAPLTLI